MKYIILLLLILLLLTSCSANRYKTEFDFANKLAQAGLWKEAYFRWQNLVAESNEKASVHNNMAIALEKMEKFEEAGAQYKIAIKLAPNNTYIADNYQRFNNRFKEKSYQERKKRNEK